MGCDVEVQYNSLKRIQTYVNDHDLIEEIHDGTYIYCDANIERIFFCGVLSLEYLMKNLIKMHRSPAKRANPLHFTLLVMVYNIQTLSQKYLVTLSNTEIERSYTANFDGMYVYFFRNEVVARNKKIFPRHMVQIPNGKIDLLINQDVSSYFPVPVMSASEIIQHIKEQVKAEHLPQTEIVRFESSR